MVEVKSKAKSIINYNSHLNEIVCKFCGKTAYFIRNDVENCYRCGNSLKHQISSVYSRTARVSLYKGGGR